MRSAHSTPFGALHGSGYPAVWWGATIEESMSEKYEKLDALILNSIGAHPKAFSAINLGAVEQECVRISKEEGKIRSPFGVSPFRICDRRLQALRKAGKIRSTTKGWIRA